MIMDDDDYSNWWSIPEPLLLQVLIYLKPCDVNSASLTCQRWFAIANDDFVWHNLIIRDFKLDTSIDLKPGKRSFHLDIYLV